LAQVIVAGYTRELFAGIFRHPSSAGEQSCGMTHGLDNKSPSDPLESFVDAAAQVLDLPVDPAWRGAVKENLSVLLRQAALFQDFSLPDETEPAPVFIA
jgi:hypothetical protein